LTFADWIEGGAGLIVATRLIEGQGIQMKAIRQAAQTELAQQIKQMKVSAYPLALSVPEIAEALPILIQASGIGPIKPNTLVINWMDQLAKGLSGIGALKYAENLRLAHRQGLNLVILNSDSHNWTRITEIEESERNIDVWWYNDATSRLMLLLAYMMTRSKIWQEARIRVITAGTGQNISHEKEVLKQLLEEYRIEAKTHIVSDYSVDTVLSNSTAATMVFIPCRIRHFKVLDASGNPLTRLLSKLPLTAMVMAAEDIDLAAEPDSGSANEIASAADALNAAEKRMDLAEKEVKRLEVMADKLTAQLSKLSKDDQRLEKLIKETDELFAETEQALRKAAKEKVKTKEAAKQLLQLTGDTDG
jgi:hypothetical protein